MQPRADSSVNKHQIPVEPPHCGEPNKQKKTKNKKKNTQVKTRCFIKFFIHKFGANPPPSAMNYQCYSHRRCQHSLYSVWQKTFHCVSCATADTPAAFGKYSYGRTGGNLSRGISVTATSVGSVCGASGPCCTEASFLG